MNNLFKFLEPGLYRLRMAPHRGGQDVGISPGGPMDRLAAVTGNILLGQEDFHPSLEIILPPRIKCLEPFYFVLTGAWRDCEIRYGSEILPVRHGEVTLVRRGAEIFFSHSRKGFRTYLSLRKYSPFDSETLIERKRGTFEQNFRFLPEGNRLRLLPGPEVELLENPEQFTSIPWKVSEKSDDMAYRLTGPDLATGTFPSLVSDAVADGTVQLTPGGPIILLYHRQTIGGYPRIFNLISSDLDFMSQYAPGERVSFRIIDRSEAQKINEQKKEDLEQFRTRFPFL